MVKAKEGSQSSEGEGAGKPLPTDLRAVLQQQLGSDLSHIRVHEKVPTQVLAKMVGAQAFTHGHDIFLKTSVCSNEGRSLLAHELTHVVQQSGGRIKPPQN